MLEMKKKMSKKIRKFSVENKYYVILSKNWNNTIVNYVQLILYFIQKKILQNLTDFLAQCLFYLVKLEALMSTQKL